MDSQFFTILAIDNNPDNLVAMKALLAGSFPQATFIAAQSGKEGIALCLSMNPDVILLDMAMPGMDGYEVCNTLKSDSLLQHIPVVMLTATSVSASSRTKALYSGADAFLSKPVDESELTAQIRIMIRLKESEDRKLTEKERLEAQVKDRTEALERELLERKKTEEALQISMLRLEKSRSAELNLLEDLRSEVTSRRKAEEKIHEHLAEQQLISEVANKLVSINNKEELFKYIGERVFEIAGDAYVYVASYNAETRSADVKHLFGFGKVLNLILKMFKVDALKISVPIGDLKPVSQNLYKSRKINTLIKDGLYTLLAGTLNKTNCNAVEKILGIKEMNVIGFNSGDNFFGGIGIFSKERKQFKQHKLIENLANQASVALQKLYAEDNLKQEHDNLNAILSSSPVGMLVIDENERIVKTNPAANHMFNKDLSGKQISLCGDFLGCINRLENVLGCGYSSKCEHCVLFASIREALASRKKILDREVLIIRNSDSGSVEVWIRFSIEPLLLNGRQHVILAIYDNTLSKMAEEEIRRKERHFRALIEQAPDGVALISEKGNYKYVSPSALKIFGYSDEMILQSNPTESTHPDDLPLVLGILADLMSCPERLITIEYRFRHADGSWRWIESTFSNLLSEPGVEAIVINFREISDRKEAERALEYSERRFRSLIENSADAIILTDAKGFILYQSPGYSRISGRTNTERIGANSLEFLHPGDKPAFEEIMAEVLQKPGTVQTLTVRNQHKDGSWQWHECAMTNLLGEPAINGIVLNIHDITRQTRAREAMRLSEAKYRGLFESNRDGISIFYVNENNIPGKFEEVNAAAAAMIGYTKEEMLEFSVTDLEITDNAELMKTRERNLRENGFASVETKIKHKNGSILIVDLLIIPIQYNERIALMNIIRDITERKLAEENLHRVRRLYALLSHINEAIFRISEPGELYQMICKLSIEFGQFRMAWIGLADETEERIKPLVSAGHADGYLDHIFISTANKPEGAGVTGFAYRMGEIMVSNEIETDPRMVPWRDEAIKRGYHSLAAVPFSLKGKQLGVLTLYASEKGFFTADEQKLLKEIGEVISYALDAMTSETERKLAEEALFKSEALLHTLVQTIPDLIWLKDTEGVYLSCNRMFTRFFGASEAEIIGKTDYDFVDRDLADFFRKNDRYAMTAGKPTSNEEWITFADDGHKAFLDTIKLPMYDSGGMLIGVLGIGHDITDRYRAEEALRESETLYRNLVLRLPDGVYKSTHEGRFVDVNPAMVEMLGYKSKNELMAVDIKKQLYFDPADRESVKLSENKVEEGVYRMKKKDGSEIWIEDHGWYNYDESRKVLFHEGIMRDVTERKRAQDEIIQLNAELEQRVKQRTFQLENTNKELESFSYSVSHDLRAPLRGIDGWSLALLEDYNERLDETGRLYLSRVRSESQRMGNLIDDLLKLSRVSRFEMKKKEVDISAMVKTISDRLIDADGGSRCEFIIQQGLTALIDPQMLEIALTNLLGNAFKFSGTKAFPKIEFGLVHKQGVQVFFVRDNGVGFDMEYAKKLFGAFQRMHKQSEFPGSGIGLATVKRIISRHGGRIWAESKPGEGTTFYFTVTYSAESENEQ